MANDGYDSDGMRDNAEMKQSEARRRTAERAREADAAAARARRQDDVRERFHRGDITMAEFAKTAREAGLSAAEVAKTLREAQAAKARGIDMAAVSRGDHAAVAQSLRATASAAPAPATAAAGGAAPPPASQTADSLRPSAAPDPIPDATLEAAAMRAGAGVPSTRSEAKPEPAGEPQPHLRRHCFMELSVGGEPRGRLVFQLFDDLVPKTAANFAALCAGTTVGDKRLHYAGCPFHRLVAGFVLQGGDLVAGDGSGSACIYGYYDVFPDERLDLPHSRPGVLSMANMGRDSNGCQFFITLQPAPNLDKKHVVFGRVVAGMRLLRQIEHMPTDQSDRPTTPLVISTCGHLSAEEAAAAAADEGDMCSAWEPEKLPTAAREERAEALDLGGEALVLAAARGDTQMLRSLVQSGIPIDAYGSVIDTYPDEAKLSHGSTTDSSRPAATVERTALHVAAHAGDAATVRALITGGCDVSLSDSRGRSALCLAAAADCEEGVRALLSAGAPVHETDEEGRAPVHLAAARGAAAALGALLEHDGSLAHAACAALLPIHLASAGGHARAVEVLASARADVSALAASEHSPLHLAAAAGAGAAVGALLAAGADASLRGERSGKTPLHCACERGRLREAEALLGAGAQPRDQDATGATALHWASRAGAASLARLLLDAGAEADASTSRGSRPLHLACEARAPELTMLLLSRGASAGRPDSSGVAPLHAAAASGCLASVRALLDAGAHVDAELRITGTHSLSHEHEQHAKRALFLAAEKGHAPLVELLLARKADPDAPATIDGAGSVSRVSALWAARRAGHDAVVEILERAGATEMAEMGQPDTGTAVLV